MTPKQIAGDSDQQPELQDEEEHRKYVGDEIGKREAIPEQHGRSPDPSGDRAYSVIGAGARIAGSPRNWKTFRTRSPGIVEVSRIGSSQAIPRCLLEDNSVSLRQRQPRLILS